MDDGGRRPYALPFLPSRGRPLVGERVGPEYAGRLPRAFNNRKVTSTAAPTRFNATSSRSRSSACDRKDLKEHTDFNYAQEQHLLQDSVEKSSPRTIRDPREIIAARQGMSSTVGKASLRWIAGVRCRPSTKGSAAARSIR